MSKNPITWVHYWPHDHTVYIGRSHMFISDADQIHHIYRNVTPSSARRLVNRLDSLIEQGGYSIFLATGYSPTDRHDLFYTDWAVFTPAWDPA